MQRINWFPDPNITGTVKPDGNNKMKVEYPVVVNNRNWIRATSTAAGDNYVQYLMIGSQIPPAGSYHVHALAYAQRAQASFQVFYRINDSYKQSLNAEVGKDQTVMVDRTIILPAGCDWILVRMQLDATTVGAIGMMSDILIERADTYATAVGGGASGLLHRGYDAARLRRFVGRVMSDDGHEYRQQSDRHNHSARRRVDANNQRPEKGRYDILRQRLYARQRRFDQLGETNNQLRSTCQLPANSHRNVFDVHVVHSRVRQSDRHRDEYAHLHVGRVSGEQDPTRQHRIFHRGYDAARLTLMGVMA